MRRLSLLTAACAVLPLLAASAAAGQAQPVGEAERRQVEELLVLRFPAVESNPGKIAEIRRLIAALGAAEFQAREDASKKLVEFGEGARAELKEAARSDDPEVSSRAELILEDIAESVQERVCRARVGLRRIRKAAVAVIDERIRSGQESAERDKKEAAGHKAAGREEAAVACLVRAKSSVDRAVELAELRKEIETDDPLDEARLLLAKGDRNEAIKKLQEYARNRMQAGKWGPDEQREYTQLIMKAHQTAR